MRAVQITWYDVTTRVVDVRRDLFYLHVSLERRAASRVRERLNAEAYRTRSSRPRGKERFERLNPGASFPHFPPADSETPFSSRGDPSTLKTNEGQFPCDNIIRSSAPDVFTN